MYPLSEEQGPQPNRRKESLREKEGRNERRKRSQRLDGRAHTQLSEEQGRQPNRREDRLREGKEGRNGKRER